MGLPAVPLSIEGGVAAPVRELRRMELILLGDAVGGRQMPSPREDLVECIAPLVQEEAHPAERLHSGALRP